MALKDTIVAWLKQLAIGPDPADDNYSTDIQRLLQGSAEGPTLALETNGAAATATTYFWKARTAVTIKSVHLVPNGTGTLNATNYATFFLQSAAGAGGAVTNVATMNTNTAGGTNIAAGVPWALTITAANKEVAAGGVLGYQITKTGAGGLAVAAHKMVVHYEEK